MQLQDTHGVRRSAGGLELRRGVIPGRSAVLLGSGVAFASGLGLLAWWNATRLTPESDPVGWSVARAAGAMEGLGTVPISDRSALGAAMVSAGVSGLESLPPGEAEAMLTDLRGYTAELLHTRFAREGADAYIALQASRGRRFLTREEFPTSPGSSLDDISLYWFGRPAGGGATPEGLFRALWNVSLDAGGGSNRAVSAATGAGAQIAFGLLEHPGVPATAVVSGSLPESVWYGSISHTCGRWMIPVSDRAFLIDRYGPLHAAAVGVVLEYENGPRRPVILRFFWDPELRLWQLDAVNVNNYQPEPGINPCPVF